jgi:N-acetylglucosamine-6-phosphate deacetylase
LSLLIENGKVVTARGIGHPAHLWIEEGRVVRVVPPGPSWTRERLDATGCLVLPGFIDVHTHGADGADTMDATPEALARMAAFYARHGVTGFLATTVTQTRKAITEAVNNVANEMQNPPPGARVLGVHLEGPYLSTAKPGAQRAAHIREADPAEYRPWLATGAVRMITLAPEVRANRALIAEATQLGISVAAAHSQATYDDVDAAIDRGLNGVSHTFNTMPGLHHRRPGLVGAALGRDALYAQIIDDRVHVHPAVVKLLVRAKTPAGTVLITDANRATGLPDGTYELGGATIEVRGGAARLPDGTLAGSTLTMDRALRHVMQDAEVDIAAAATMAALSPARALKLGAGLGDIAPGRVADLVLLDEASLTVRATLVGGRAVYEA